MCKAEKYSLLGSYCCSKRVFYMCVSMHEKLEIVLAKRGNELDFTIFASFCTCTFFSVIFHFYEFFDINCDVSYFPFLIDFV